MKGDYRTELGHEGNGNDRARMGVYKVIKKQNHLLTKGRASKIGFFESIPLRISGRRDGVRGLPRQNDEGVWTSAVLNRELHSYKEFCDKAWGKLQIDIAEEYSRLGFLIENAKSLEERLENAKKKLGEANSVASNITERKNGEEQLSVSQVRNRRTREHNKHMAPFKATVNALESEIKEYLAEAIAIKNTIVEANNATRLVCEKVKDHIRQRMDVYWNATLAKHPNSEKVPVIPSLRMIPDAELVYYRQHKSFLEELEATITYLGIKYDVTTERREQAS